MKACLVGLMLLIGASAAWGQTCIGAAPLGGAQIGATLQFRESFTNAMFDVGGGSRGFGRLSFGVTNYTDIDESALSLAFIAGSEYAGDTSKRTSLCPIGYATFDYGPHQVLGEELKVRSWSGMGGLGFSAIVADSQTVQAAPFIAFLVGSETDSFLAFGERESVSETFGVVIIGGAIVLKQGPTISPSVVIPFMVEDAVNTFRLVVSFPLRR